MKQRQLTQDQFVEEFGITPEQMAQESTEFTASSKFLSENWDSIKQQYPHRWVGLTKGKVVADADSLAALLSIVDSRGIDRRNLLIEDMGTDDEILILQCR